MVFWFFPYGIFWVPEPVWKFIVDHLTIQVDILLLVFLVCFYLFLSVSVRACVCVSFSLSQVLSVSVSPLSLPSLFLPPSFPPSLVPSLPLPSFLSFTPQNEVISIRETQLCPTEPILKVILIIYSCNHCLQPVINCGAS